MKPRLGPKMLNQPLLVKSWLFWTPLSCVINWGSAEIKGADVLVFGIRDISEPGVVTEAGVDVGPNWGVPAQLDWRELVGVLLGDMSISSWCSEIIGTF